MAGFSSKRRKIRQPDSEFPLLKGSYECVSLKYTPPLVNAHFGGTYASYIIKSFFQFQSYLSQLETLVLDLRFEKLTCFPKLPKLRNLKQLELELNSRVFCLLLCTSLLRASPSLNIFKIKFFDLEKRTKEKMEINKSEGKHKCLKVVKLIGFVGCRVDLEIARYILSHTLSLEKIIINPRHPFIVTFADTDEHLKARSRARQHLEHRLPPGTQLVVL